MLAPCFLLYKVDKSKVAQDFGACSKGARRAPWPNFNRKLESQFDIKSRICHGIETEVPLSNPKTLIKLRKLDFEF